MQGEQLREEGRRETRITMTGREVRGKEVVPTTAEEEAAEITVDRSFQGLLLAIREAVAMETAQVLGGARMTEGLGAAGMNQAGAAEEGNHPATVVEEDTGEKVTAEVVVGREGTPGLGIILLTAQALGLGASQALGMEEEATPSTTLDRAWEELTGLEVEEEGGPQEDFQHRLGLSCPWVEGCL